MNCLEMEGAEEIGCIEGECKAASCKIGYSLEGERCLR